MNRPPIPFAILGAALALSCGCDSTAPVDLEDCPAAVTVAVGSGTTPTFSWQPTCRLFFLIVEPADAGTDLWLVIFRGENGISPPVVYGAVPAGATQRASAATLQPGTAYKVGLARFTGPGDEDGEIIAVQEFTP